MSSNKNQISYLFAWEIKSSKYLERSSEMGGPVAQIGPTDWIS